MRRDLLAMALSIAVASAGYAQPTAGHRPDIIIDNAWARPSIGAATTGAAYFTITDNAAADHLIGVTTPVAGKAELHESRTVNGVMQMRPAPRLPLEPGKSVTLAPGGYHVMLMDLKQPLKSGESFPVTLSFEKAQPITVQVMVRPAGAAAPMPEMHGSHSTGGSKP